jgi:hypothetical protein
VVRLSGADAASPGFGRLFAPPQTA